MTKLDTRLEWLEELIPDEARAARLLVGHNDVSLMIFIEKMGDTTGRVYGTSRAFAFKEIGGLFPEATQTLKNLARKPNIDEVPIIVRIGSDFLSWVAKLDSRSAGSAGLS